MSDSLLLYPIYNELFAERNFSQLCFFTRFHFNIIDSGITISV